MDVQRKYGVQYLKYDNHKLRKLSKLFVDVCLYTYNDIAKNNPDIKFYEIFLMSFLFMFCRETEKESDNYNQLYKIMRQFYDNITPEAHYMNELIIKTAENQVTTA